jgi:hypothetical protein
MGLFNFIKRKTAPSSGVPSKPSQDKGNKPVIQQDIFYWSLSLKASGNPNNLSDWLVLGKAIAEPDGKGGTTYKSEFYGQRDMITVVEIESARYWKESFDTTPSLVEKTIEHIQSLQDALGIDNILDKDRSSTADEPIVQAAVTVTVAYMLVDLDSYNAGELINAAVDRRKTNERGGSVYKILRLTQALQARDTNQVIPPELQHHIVKALRSWPRKDATGS